MMCERAMMMGGQGYWGKGDCRTLSVLSVSWWGERDVSLSSHQPATIPEMIGPGHGCGGTKGREGEGKTSQSREASGFRKARAHFSQASHFTTKKDLDSHS